MEVIAGCWGTYDAFIWQLAADRGRNADPSTHLHDILRCKASDSVDLVQMSKDECRHREGLVDDGNTSVAVLEADCFLCLAFVLPFQFVK